MESAAQHTTKRPRLYWSPTGPLPDPSPSEHHSFTTRDLDRPGNGPLPSLHDDYRRRPSSDQHATTPGHGRTYSNPFTPPFHQRELAIKHNPADNVILSILRSPSSGPAPVVASHPSNPNPFTPLNPNLAPHVNLGSALHHKRTDSVSSRAHPASFPEDHRRHLSLDAGTQFRQSAYPLPSLSLSHQHTIPYDTTGFVTRSTETNSPYSSNVKRKATRASQACDSCRQLKARCDETRPCKGCFDKGLECKYRDPILKPTDKAQADILDGINDLKRTISSFTIQFCQLRDRVERIEEKAQSFPSYSGLTRNGPLAASGSDFRLESPNLVSTPDEHRIRPRSDHSLGQVLRDEEDEIESQPGPPVNPGRPAMPINHTSHAGLLLGWPAVTHLVKDLLEREEIEHVAEYPIRKEQERGILRVHGRGEGHDKKWVWSDYGSLDSTDETSELSNPGADWGLLGSICLDPKSGILSHDASPDFSPDVVRKFATLFREHILKLHPLIMPKELDDMVQSFLEDQSSKPTSSKFCSTPVIAKELALNNLVDPADTKRKRSPSPDGILSSALPVPRTSWPHRTITNAVVLLVMALGKICQVKDSVPDLVPLGVAEHERLNTKESLPDSPISSSPPVPMSRSNHSGLPSPHDSDYPRLWQSGGMTGRQNNLYRRNCETVPGLEYFALATDIIGNQLGGTSIKHVWAGILAGIYHGQLGRVMESYAYISNGSRILQIILRPSLDRLRKIRDNAPQEVITRERDNQLALAYWTCLHLESDLLAELPLPHSGILNHEDDIPYPNVLLAENAYEPSVFESFMAQLYLRRHLNTIHTMFYHPGANIRLELGDDNFSHVDMVQDRVQTMSWVSSRFQFDEDDPPPNEILAARLRGKYWGAKVITYRPFVKQILQFTADLSADSVGAITPALYRQQLNPQAIEYARLGIRALIESTRAYHNLGPDRPILTDGFASSHAQWGNLLVLSACFKDPFLGQFVDRDLLQTLYGKTRVFLRRFSTKTCNVRRDMRILEGVARQIFQPEFTNAFVNSPPPAPRPDCTTNSDDNSVASRSPSAGAPLALLPPLTLVTPPAPPPSLQQQPRSGLVEKPVTPSAESSEDATIS